MEMLVTNDPQHDTYLPLADRVAHYFAFSLWAQLKFGVRAGGRAP